MPTDLDLDDSSTNGDSSTENSANQDATIADLKRRLSGQTKSVDRLMKEVLELRSKATEGQPEVETELSELRVRLGDLDKQYKQRDQEYQTLTQAKQQVERERDLLKQNQDVAAFITEKFPALLNDFLIGDLKLKSEFADDAKYEEYLDRQSKKAAPVAPEGDGKQTPGRTTLKDRMTGATPSASSRISEGAGKARPAIEIADEMMSLSSNDPKYAELEAELNRATSI